MCERLDTLQMLQSWNQSPEQIMAWTAHDQLTFVTTIQEMPVVTVTDTQKTDDLRQEIVFRGYILEHIRIYGFPRSVTDMKCYLHYSNDYTELIQDYLYIKDFTVTRTERGKGHGSLMMQFVKNYAGEKHLQYISGCISPIDASEKLYRFYKKHGFIIDNSRIYCNLL